MKTARPDPLALRDEPTERLTVTLPRSTVVALHHYCLRSGADAGKIPVAAARIIDAFLERDTAFKRWRADQGDKLPATLPARSSKRSGEHA